MQLLASTTAAILALYLTMAVQMPSSSQELGQGVLADTSELNRIGRGAALFSRTCQRCHNPRSPAERTDREWVIIMQHMQTRASLTREQTELVRDFLLASNDADLIPGRLRENLSEPDSSEISDAMIERGKMVYDGAGTCFACHGAQLEGGPIAPNLNDGQWKIGDGTYAFILSVVRNGVSGTAMAAYPGGITDQQAAEVSAYLWSVSSNQKSP